MMTSAVLDPRLQKLANEIEGALSGQQPTGGAKGYLSGQSTDSTKQAASVAGSLLAAYQTSAMLNPTKAFKSKGLVPQLQISDPSLLTDKSWWNSVWDVVQTVAPVVINAMSKDYAPPQSNLSSIIQSVPAHRRNDKDWVDFATTLLLNVAQGTIDAIRQEKDFSDPNNQPQIPMPPANADKNFLSDAWDFVQDAAPIAGPILLSLL